MLAVADIGGTNARFAIAVREGRGWRLIHRATLPTDGFPRFADAFAAWRAGLPGDLPVAGVSVALAGPVDGARILMTNADWTFDAEALPAALGVPEVRLVNDFAAQALGAGVAPDDAFVSLGAAPWRLPETGVVSVLGPGTGLGAAMLVREARGGEVRNRALATEGGHIGFAPFGPDERAIADQLEARFGRVSAERVVSGPGIANLYRALTGREMEPADIAARAADGGDRDAARALELFFGAFGAVAGDLALAHGAAAVVLTGGVTIRLATQLAASEFLARFAAKGRFQARLAAMPTAILSAPDAGLWGAAEAFGATR